MSDLMWPQPLPCSSADEAQDDVPSMQPPAAEVEFLVDKLAVVTCIVDDCAEFVAEGGSIPEATWGRLRLLILSNNIDCDRWRALPMYARARSQILFTCRNSQ